jgi:GDP-D-mannose 3',5'-epimerase
MLYIDDCVEGMWRLASGAVHGPVNLAHRDPISVNEIVTQLEDIAGINLHRFYSPGMPVGCRQKTADITKLRRALSWEPMTDFRVGLERTYSELWDTTVCRQK